MAKSTCIGPYEYYIHGDYLDPPERGGGFWESVCSWVPEMGLGSRASGRVK